MEEIKEWYYAVNETVFGPMPKAELIRLYNDKYIFNYTKVWKIGMADWVFFDESELMNNIVIPPPLHTMKIDNKYVWIVAFSPLIYLILCYLFVEIEGASLFISFCICLINMALCIDDQRVLKKLGYNTKEILLWAIFFQPVYLFRRANILKQSFRYAITGLICFCSYYIVLFLASFYSQLVRLS